MRMLGGFQAQIFLFIILLWPAFIHAILYKPVRHKAIKADVYTYWQTIHYSQQLSDEEMLREVRNWHQAMENEHDKAEPNKSGAKPSRPAASSILQWEDGKVIFASSLKWGSQGTMYKLKFEQPLLKTAFDTCIAESTSGNNPNNRAHNNG